MLYQGIALIRNSCYNSDVPDLVPPSDSDAEHIEAVMAVIVRLIRKEVAPLLGSGNTWKLTVNGDGSAGGVRVTVERHLVLDKKFFTLA
jgi:hypothetical protein